MEEKTYHKIKDQILFKGDKLEFCLKEIEISNSSKNSKSTCFWEYITNITSFKSVQTVGCLAYIKPKEILKEIGELTIIILENYYTPVEKKVLEFPFGQFIINDYFEVNNLHAENDSKTDDLLFNYVTSQITDQLEKKSGYTGVIKDFFKINDNKMKINSCLLKNIYFSPWISDENSTFALIEINELKEKNIKEESVVHKVKLNNLLDFIMEKVEKESYACAAYVFYFAFGMMFKEIFKEYLV